MLDPAREKASRILLEKIGVGSDFTVEHLPGGRNNRVLKIIEGEGDKAVILKEYFRHPADLRDRCKAEFDFLRFAWNSGTNCVPEPLACDLENGLAIYAFVAGRRLHAGDITMDRIDEAAGFFHAINNSAGISRPNLGNASEACFSIASHLACTERRVQALVAACSQEMNAEVRSFVQSKMVPLWNSLRIDVEWQCETLQVPLAEEINSAKRRISPSDFGFHNTIKMTDGRLCFLDFEYAGWDDIAKTVCDFFLQPVFPMPEQYFQKVADKLLGGSDDNTYQMNRVKILLPVHQMKWCCIMLNDFLPLGNARRKFSLAEDGESERKAHQLALARAAFHKIGYLTEAVTY